MKISTNLNIEKFFEKYPTHAKKQLNTLRKLILKQAEKDGISSIEETLKWGEPSYIAPKGSTIRMDWKAKNPNEYALYFSCSSKLVPTFRILYPTLFTFEGNRAIVFQLNDAIPTKELSHCISLALNYHQVKNLPLLGA